MTDARDTGGEPDIHALRSVRFRAERQPSWSRLETLLMRCQGRGHHSLTAEELLELPHLYRATLASLSVARSYVLDARLIAYLEALAWRAHQAVFASTEPAGQAFWRILARDLPRSVRRLAAPTLLAAATLALGMIVGWVLVMERPDLFASLVPADLAAGRTPYATTKHLLHSIGGGPLSFLDLQGMALDLMRNNIFVSLLTLGAGLAFGVPTALLLFYNGTVIGALVAVFSLRGLDTPMIAWLSIHGTTELTAIILAGGAGFGIARAMLFPRPRQSRVSAARDIGPDVARVGLAMLIMLLIAAFLEAFARTRIVDTMDRFMVGGAFLAFWVWYFTRCGRDKGGA